MKYNENTLAKAHKAGALPNALLLYGGESWLVEQWARRLTGAGEDSGPFNAQRLDGKKPDLDALWDALQAMPLFAREKTVLLDGLEAASLAGDDLKTFAQLLYELPESTFFVAASKDPGFGGSAAGKKLVKLFDEKGAAAELSARTPADMVKFLTAGAKARGRVLSPALAQYLLRLCPNDMRILDGELDKICAYAGDDIISQEHIDAVAVPKLEAQVFDLQKHILAGDARAALGLLAGLFALRNEPVMITAVLSSAFCDLYRARCVRDAGGNAATLARDFGYKSDYRARRAYDEAGKRDTRRLRRAVLLLCDCDRLMKSTGIDQKLRLEQTVVRLISLCAARRR